MNTQKLREAYGRMNLWLSQPDLPSKIYRELKTLEERLEADSGDKEAREEIYDRFYQDLDFGTGGLRGILGAGTNRMNIYTVRKVTQGLADYLQDRYGNGEEHISVAIAYDSRIQSESFALEAGRVLSANGINVHIYPELMPTPTLSFAVRYHKCCGGIMITASHNPSNYNGYKVYNKEGCQVTPEEAEEITSFIERVDPFADIKKGSIEEKCNINIHEQHELKGCPLHFIPDETVNAYIEAVKSSRTGMDCRNIEVVYTPLNGAGNKMVRRILDEIGTGKVHVVPEQEHPDGNFPTCPYPNPEKEEALRRGLALCASLKTPDLLLATDPDCDRLGIAVRKEDCGNGISYEKLTGNEVGVLLLDFLCKKKKMVARPIAMRTIVSSKMADAVAKEHGVVMIRLLTGFKYIGERIGQLESVGEENRFIFGFEESYGYLAGSYVRDKDAVAAAMLVTEAAAYYKKEGKTLIDRMEELYRKHGYFIDELLYFSFDEVGGMERMAGIMSGLRSTPPIDIIGRKVIEISDYLLSKRRAPERVAGEAAFEIKPISLPKSDVLEYILEGASSVIVRPSGTEPNLKVYLSARGDTRESAMEIINNMRDTVKEWLPV